MMKAKIALFAFAGLLLSGCEGMGRMDTTMDQGLDRKSLADLRAGIWVDPNGCEHWIIDDGIEGYLSQRLHHNGRPVCGNPHPPGTILGEYRSGSLIGDPL